MIVTKEQIVSAIRLTAAVGEAIRELKEVPSGTMYARVASYLSLNQFNSIIDQLKKAGLVVESNHVLKWVEPS